MAIMKSSAFCRSGGARDRARASDSTCDESSKLMPGEQRRGPRSGRARRGGSSRGQGADEPPRGERPLQARGSPRGRVIHSPRCVMRPSGRSAGPGARGPCAAARSWAARRRRPPKETAHRAGIGMAQRPGSAAVKSGKCPGRVGVRVMLAIRGEAEDRARRTLAGDSRLHGSGDARRWRRSPGGRSRGATGGMVGGSRYACTCPMGQVLKRCVFGRLLGRGSGGGWPRDRSAGAADVAGARRSAGGRVRSAGPARVSWRVRGVRGMVHATTFVRTYP